MTRLRRCCFILVALLGALVSPLSAVPATHAATTSQAACDFTFPSSPALRVLAVSSGAGTILRLSAGGYSFTLSRYNGFNAAVRQALGITPPPGDTVASFAFGIPGGHSYVGLTNVVQQGVQAQICLRGVAYPDLGNGSNSGRIPPVAVTLAGTIGASYARVDLYAGAAYYFVYGLPRTQGAAPLAGARASICPPSQVCDAALGVMLPVPAGWSAAPSGHNAPGTLALVK